MKNVLLGFALLAGSASFLAASTAPLAADSETINTASGNGSISFEEEGRGVVHFVTKQTEEGTTGKLLFAADHPHGFPEIIIRVNKISRASFSGRTVKFSARGMLHGEPVKVKGSAYDGAGTLKADRFVIEAFDESGEEIFHAHGEVLQGDIVVGAVE